MYKLKSLHKHKKKLMYTATSRLKSDSDRLMGPEEILSRRSSPLNPGGKQNRMFYCCVMSSLRNLQSEQKALKLESEVVM